MLPYLFKQLNRVHATHIIEQKKGNKMGTRTLGITPINNHLVAFIFLLTLDWFEMFF